MIRKLPPELIREIAAGEVVQSPVDIVKELLDNALDAGGTRLELAIISGGIKNISLKDNGVGIPKDELALALEPHATSKLERLDHISTLGFRGEGLYAIRNAAHIELRSRPKHQLGGAMVIAEGDSLRLNEVPLPAGTSVSVSQLFSKLPARFSSLDSAASESKKILNLLSRYLFHHPQLYLKFSSDDSEKWTFSGGSTLDAVKFFWGSVTANRLLTLEFKQSPYQLQGVLSRPELSRSKRDRLFLAVNGRPVEWTDELLQVIVKGYQELLPSGHYPVGVLNLTLPFDEVLVNTAPDKSKVRFLKREVVYQVVELALQELFASHPLARALPDLQAPQTLSRPQQHHFPKLNYLGNYQELYLLGASENELWVIDQHAAHERIIYEELTKRYRQEAPVVLPYVELVHLTEEEMASYFLRVEALEGVGFGLEPFGPQTLRLRTVPALLLDHPNLINDILKQSLGFNSLEEAWRKILARLACLPALKAGHRLDVATSQALLEALMQCDNPWTCPHGRPTALVISELELSRRFGRRAPRATSPKPV